MTLKRFTHPPQTLSLRALSRSRKCTMKELNTSRVSREKRGHVLLIGLDRVAKRNAFDLDLLNELSLAYGEFEADSEARVAVVFGHGEHFTAGLDLVSASAALSEGWQAPPGGCDPWGSSPGPGSANR